MYENWKQLKITVRFFFNFYKCSLILKPFRYNASVASENSIKKNVSTQTSHVMTDKCYQIESIPIPEINKPYEKLKTCLYPDLFGSQYDKNGNKIN